MSHFWQERASHLNIVCFYVYFSLFLFLFALLFYLVAYDTLNRACVTQYTPAPRLPRGAGRAPVPHSGSLRRRRAKSSNTMLSSSSDT